MQKGTIAVVVAVALVAGAGLVHGKLSDRWGSSAALEAALARVPEVPLRIDGLIGEELPTDPKEFGMAGASAYWMRNYRDPDKKTTTLVILMCGRPGLMSVHTPDVCYQGAGYEMLGDPGTAAFDELGLFWTARFVKQSLGSDDLRLFWGWTNDGTWRAPASPRWEFRGGRFLYKLYVAQRASGRDEKSGRQAAEATVRRLLPAIRKTLFEEAPPSATGG